VLRLQDLDSHWLQEVVDEPGMDDVSGRQGEIASTALKAANSSSELILQRQTWYLSVAEDATENHSG
jgi:hypothetical protein